MSLAELVLPALQTSVAVLVFTVGLGTTPAELMHLVRRPGKLLRSLVSMNLVMLVVAVGIVMVFPLGGPMKVMLVALALSPIPPVLPKKLVKAGGGHDYVMALLCTASVFAIIWIPLAGEVLDRIFPADITIPVAPMVKLVSMTVLGPTLAGVAVRLIAPGLAQRIAGPLGTVATVLLLCGLGLILFKAWPAMLAQLGNGTLLAIVAFVLLGLVSGHLLGGPDPGDRSVLALATACRHPGVALAIAQITFPAEQAVTAAALLYLVTSMVVTMPYVAWRRKALDADHPPAIAEGAAPP